MTDFRNGNDVCFMQQQQQEQSQQQKANAVLRETFHTKYNSNSTPERLQLSTEEQCHTQQQNPLLQSLIDYTHSLSSQAGCVTAIGQHYNGNTGGIPPMDGIQFDEHAIYYVSPTKRKSSFRSTILANVMPLQQEHQQQEHQFQCQQQHHSKHYQQQQPQQQGFRISSPIRNTIYCNEMAGPTIIPTTLSSTVGTILTNTTTTTAAAVTAIMTTTTTTTATNDSGSRLAGVVHDFSIDDTSSHFSDTAMQVLRSGSISGNIGDTNNRFNNFCLTTTTMPTSTTATLNNHYHNNNNNNSHSSSSSSLATTGRCHNNNAMVKFSQTLTHHHHEHQYNGSLQRNKGRSTQSLCSCDAGIDTEINLDSTRPLYQYDVEGKNTHTYTCEQNAHILMRLERDRRRKLSLGTDIDIGIGQTMPMQKPMTTTGCTKTDTQVEIIKKILI